MLKTEHPKLSWLSNPADCCGPQSLCLLQKKLIPTIGNNKMREANPCHLVLAGVNLHAFTKLGAALTGMALYGNHNAVLITIVC